MVQARGEKDQTLDPWVQRDWFILYTTASHVLKFRQGQENGSQGKSI